MTTTDFTGPTPGVSGSIEYEHVANLDPDDWLVRSFLVHRADQIIRYPVVLFPTVEKAQRWLEEARRRVGIAVNVLRHGERWDDLY